ncbi:MAG: hypothetical protein LBV52_02170 [Spirochaetaceae bacterium]|nr:hypothetical protein [Spirochaetaceae bacterium]
MPTYEYECKKCSNHFEVFQSMKDDPLKVCPQCGAEVARVISGGGGVIFKGSGFYSTDKGQNKQSDAVPPAKPACASCPHADAPCAAQKAAG